MTLLRLLRKLRRAGVRRSALERRRKQSVLSLLRRSWIASLSLSSGARTRDPLARNDDVAGYARLSSCLCEERLRRSNPSRGKRRDGLLRGACHRARIRATRWLAMTRKHVCPFSRHGLPEVLRIRCPSLEERGRRECRVRAAPAVSCAKRLRIGAHEHTGQRRTLRHPPRNGFTAYSALSPATNSFCHRHLRIGSSAGPVGPTSPPQTWHQQRMPGPHGFTVRNRVARLVCRSIAHEVHLALQSQARTTLPRPPHPIPTLGDYGQRPSRG
jgi:hypothetical protein